MRTNHYNPYLTRLNSFGKRQIVDRTCISLFSGGGGLDLGAYLAHFKTLFASDIKPEFIQTIKHNIPEVNVYARDAMQLTPETIRDLSGLGNADLDLMIAGPPCQSFSILGKRGSLGDPRGQLTVKYIELVSGIRPKAFVFENVPGLLTVNNGFDFQNLWSYMQEETGYKLFLRRCNACEYGIPQSRERVIIVGFRSDINCEDFVYPTKPSGKHVRNLPDKVPSKWALEELNDVPNHQIREHSTKVRERYKKIPPGGRDRVDHTDRINPEVPSGTVLVGSSAGGGRPHIHPYEPRVITVREAARLQSFPDWYEFCGSSTDQYRQVGNAVPVLMAYEILKNIRIVLEKQ